MEKTEIERRKEGGKNGEGNKMNNLKEGEKQNNREKKEKRNVSVLKLTETKRDRMSECAAICTPLSTALKYDDKNRKNNNNRYTESYHHNCFGVRCNSQSKGQ